jgi:transglutaminase-like putative cysteine protease
MGHAEKAAEPAERFFQLSLLGLLACGYLAIAGSGYLPPLIIGITAAPLLIRFLLVTGIVRFDLPDSWVTALTIAYVCFYPVDYFLVSNDFLQASVHLVLFLAAAKLLTARTDRDYASLIAIALLELLAAAILSLSLSFFVFLGLFLWFAVSTFVSWEIRRSVRSSVLVSRTATRFLSRRVGALAALLTIGILLLTSGLFFLLPRTARAAFQRLVPERFQVTAFSNEVTLGEIGEVKRSSAVMMHFHVDGVDGPVPLKWRGTALGRFDGKKWSNPHVPGEPLRIRANQVVVAGDDQRRRRGTRINYEVQLQPFTSGVIFVAGRPEVLRTNLQYVKQTPWESFQLLFPIPQVLQYGVYSYVEDGSGQPPPVHPPLPPTESNEYLSLPLLDRRIGELARRVTFGSAIPADKARALERHLQTSYGYTIELPATEPPDPLANFLFERRAGHCEYFASAMAVMLRTLGIPSRVATGFQSGTYNPISGWHVVRGSDAHSWVEAFIPNLGWVTYDPTPPDYSAVELGLWARISLVIDAAETFWQNWVVNYDENRQYSLLASLDQIRRDWFDGRRIGAVDAWLDFKNAARAWAERHGRLLVGVLVLAVAFVVAALIARPWLIRRLRARRVRSGAVRASDATVLYLRALALLRRIGFEKPPSVTPSEFVRQLPASAPGAIFTELTDAYNELRFGGRRETASRLILLLDQLEHVIRS